MTTPPPPPPADDSGYPPPPPVDPPRAAQQQPPPGYVWGPVPMVAPTNTMAILSLVLAFVFAPAGIVLGHIARSQIRDTGERGDGLALAGLIIGYVLTGMMLLSCLAQIGMMAVFLGTFPESVEPADAG